MKRALVTGITGQDGSYLAELLLGAGYTVHGLIRRSSSFHTGRIDHIYDHPALTLHYGDLADAASLRRLMAAAAPDEIYHLGAQSHVRLSFDMPEYTIDCVGLGTLRMLEAFRDVCPQARFYQASSSEMFGNAPPPQDETTPLQPLSPYAVAKVMAHQLAGNYRDAYGLYIVRGSLFNHTSVRRSETFVSRKITRAVGRIATGRQHALHLGNLDAVRDWGSAREYMDAVHLMLQQLAPADYVIGSGEAHSVRWWLQTAFEAAGRDYHDHVQFDQRLTRPAEVHRLTANAARACAQLGWSATTDAATLCRQMVEHDLALARHEAAVPA